MSILQNLMSYGKLLNRLVCPLKEIANKKYAFKTNGTVSFDAKKNAGTFKTYFKGLESELVNKLPNPPNKFGIGSVKNYYEDLHIKDKKFNLKLLEEIKSNKAVGIGNLAGVFRKDGSDIIAEPITVLINLSIKLVQFPDAGKNTRLKPLYKKDQI